MQTGNAKISSSQLTLLIIGFIAGSSLVLTPSPSGEHDAWLTLILGVLESVPVILLFVALAKLFPNKTFVEISKEVFGSWISIPISLLYLWFLFHLASVVVNNFCGFITTTTLPATPTYVISTVLLSVCAYAVFAGIEVLARCAQVLVPLIFVTVSFTTILLLQHFSLDNFLPIMEIPTATVFKAAHEAATFPFMEAVAFLMVFPALNKTKQIRSATLIAVIMAAILLLTSTIRNIGVLGATQTLSVYPSFFAVRLIDYGHVLTRIEVSVVINLMSMGFIKISILLHGTTMGMAQLLGLRTHKPLIIPTAILVLLLMLLNFSNIAENLEFAKLAWPIYSLPFVIGLPLLTYITARVRGLGNG